METNENNNINIFSKERARLAEENNQKRKESKLEAQALLQSSEGRAGIINIIGRGGSLGRRIEREIKRFESTGRVSSWFANFATQGEVKKATAQASESGSKQTSYTQVTSRALTTAPPLPTIGPFKWPERRLEIPSYTPPRPFDIIPVRINGNVGSRNYTLRVVAGTISNILPSNWDSEFPASDGSDYYGVITLKTDGRRINSVSIKITTSEPSKQEPKKFSVDSSVDVLFGIFRDGNSSNIFYNYYPYFIPRLRLVTSADPPAAAGESPFDLWYELAP